MKKPKFSLVIKDEELTALVDETNHKDLATWAIAVVERILPFFEMQFPEDLRPRQALETLQTWVKTGEFKMSVIRGAALASHAAAREVGEDNPARSAARAAGQAVATAHVRTHAIAAANYALQAVHRASSPETAQDAVAQERRWQYQHLLEINRATTPLNPLIPTA